MNTAQWDQLMASFRDLAETMAKYRDELLEQGFERQEVIRMVIAYQTSLLGMK
ncbi:hypothetical protein [Paenibacillus rhizosphaerae]|uniref:hypothetical protein n=1 Tax=Paenibacillus rhizosphaerae TaxID=297318 RepID=UPI00142DE012|nr:hypothetical protein [Paenibacillus rhizosphaerae]